MMQTKTTTTGVNQLINDIELLSGKDSKELDSDHIDIKKDDLQMRQQHQSEIQNL